MDLLSSFSSVPFYLIAAATLIFTLAMITNKNLVRAGFLLIGAFCSIAGIYFLLYANFVAVSQILIYAVGIVLVIIFAVMLCSLKESAAELSDSHAGTPASRKLMAALLSLTTFGLLTTVIFSQNWKLVAFLTGSTVQQAKIEELAADYLTRIGDQMLTLYILPFELISILLLVVLIGVIILSKKVINEEAK